MPNTFLYSLGLSPVQRAAVDGAAWPFASALHFDDDRDLADAVSGRAAIIVLTGAIGRTLPILDAVDRTMPLIIFAFDDIARGEVENAQPIRRQHEIVRSLDDLPGAIERLSRAARVAGSGAVNLGRLIMERSFDAIFVSDSEGRYVAANPAGVKLLGYDVDELSTKCVHDVVEPEDQKRQPARLRELAEGASLRSERRLVRKDGSIIDVEISASRLSEGLLLGIVRDITERKRLEADLRLNERQLIEAQSLARAASWRWVVGSGGVRLAPTLALLLGLSPDIVEVTLFQLRSLVVKEERKRMDDALSAACRNHTALDEVVNLDLPDGRHGVYHIRGAPWESPGPYTFIGFTQDVTEQVQAQERLAATLRQQRAVAEAGAFALAGGSLDELWGRAVASIAEHLPSEIATLALFHDNGSLVLEAARGWAAEEVGHRRLRSDPRSANRYTLSTGAPVIIDNLPNERRFEAPSLLEKGIVSGILIPVAGTMKHGVLGAFSRVPHTFSEDDITYASGIANVVAAAMDRAAVLQELAREHDSLQTLLNALPDRIIRYRKNMTIAFSNVPPASDGDAEMGPCGRYCSHALFCAEIVRDTFRTGMPRTGQLPLTADGRIQQLRTVPEANVAGEVEHVLTVCTDLTVQIRAREERDVLAMRLEQSERVAALGRVAAVIAHEFNSVLMAVNTSLEVMSRSAAGQQVMDILALARQSIARGKSITQEILRYARPSDIVRQPLELPAWIHATTAEAKSVLPAGIDLIVRMADGPLTMAADSAQLQQVVINLIMNAREAMPGGGTITFSAEREPGGRRYPFGYTAAESEIHLAISDTGCGIPPQERAKIFEPLFTTKRNGTGLGLAVVQQIVLRHGGSIFVESEVGAGTTFHIFMPHGGTA